MSGKSFNIASGKQTEKQTGGRYSRDRVTIQSVGTGMAKKRKGGSWKLN